MEKEESSELIYSDIDMFTPFSFKVKERNLPKNRDYTLVEKSINLNIRHTLIQERLYKMLCEKYGYENVSLEHRIGGKKIDIVLRDNNSFVFYESKVTILQKPVFVMQLDNSWNMLISQTKVSDMVFGCTSSGL